MRGHSRLARVPTTGKLDGLTADHVGFNELHPELRSRVAAAAGQATQVEVTRDGPGYRVTAESGQRTVEMYLELRPDGSVREETAVHSEPPSEPGVSEGARDGFSGDVEDELLIEQISAALLAIVTAGDDDLAGHRDRWQTVIDNIREIERRHPPGSGSD